MAGFERGLSNLRQRLSSPPRRDGVALGFGIAFIVFGALGVLRAAGLQVATEWLYPVIFIGLGLAGLASALFREQR